MSADPLLSAFLDDLVTTRDLAVLAVLCDYLQEQEHPSAAAVRQSWRTLVKGYDFGFCRFCNMFTWEGMPYPLCGATSCPSNLSCWEDELASIWEHLGRELPTLPPPLPPLVVEDWKKRWPRRPGHVQGSTFLPCKPLLTRPAQVVKEVGLAANRALAPWYEAFDRCGLCPWCNDTVVLEPRRYFFSHRSAVEGILVWSVLHEAYLPREYHPTHVLWWKQPRRRHEGSVHAQ
jgi:hypothetical protein